MVGIWKLAVSSKLHTGSWILGRVCPQADPAQLQQGAREPQAAGGGPSGDGESRVKTV